MESIFNVDKVKSLRKKSENALGVFKKTVSDLALANSEIVAEQQKKQQRIDVLVNEVKELHDIKSENEVFISRINTLLGATGKE